MTYPKRAGHLRAVLVGATAVALLASSGAVGPAFAAAGDVELLPNGSFTGASTTGWNIYGDTSHTAASDTLCVDVPGGTANNYTTAAEATGVTLQAGKTYTLSFSASAAPATTPHVSVQSAALGYASVFGLDPALTTSMGTFGGTFTPATGQSSNDFTISFQLGAQSAAYTFCLDNVSLMGPPATPAPQGAELIGNGTFATTANPWNVYGDTAHSVSTGALCIDVPGGTANTYDAAAQFKNLTLTAGETYTYSYDASTTPAAAPKFVIQSAANGYFTYATDSSTLSGTMTTYSGTFTVPAGKSATDAEFSFQLGAQAAAYTFCLDNVSLKAASASNQIVNGTFTPDYAGWNVSGALASNNIVNGQFCTDVAAGGTDPYIGISQNTLNLTQGSNYALDFDASTSIPRNVRVNVGQAVSPYTTYKEWAPALVAAPTHFHFVFTSSATDPAAQLAFQMGTTTTPFTFCLDNVVFSPTTEVPLYVPNTGPRVRVNQETYLPNGPKGATLVSTATSAVPWQLMKGATAVASGTTTPAGVDPTSGLNVATIDFSGVTAVGTGYTLVADGDTSYPFDISAAAYERLRKDSQNFFYTQRSGEAILSSVMPNDPISGNSYARAAGHVSVAPNTGDVADPCMDATMAQAAYGSAWTCPAGYVRDVTGGWYDAGDQGKYVVNGGIAVYQLMNEFERTKTARSTDLGALGDNTMRVPTTANGVPDTLDNARFELEWMLKMQVPAGTMMSINGATIDAGGLVHHKVHDQTWTGLNLDPAADPKIRELHRPSTAATLNLAAVAAQGARLFASYDKAFSDKLLAASKAAYAAAMAHPDIYATVTDGSGGGAYEDNNVTDEFYWAAAELYITTGADTYKADVLASPHNTANVFDIEGFSWGTVAALGRLDLATVPNALPTRAAARQSVLDAADAIVALQNAQPWDQPYAPVSGKWAWGSTSSVLNNIVVAATAYDISNRAVYRNSAVKGMDWLLGRNALNISFITGYGDVFSQNQHSRMYSNQLNSSLPHPPAGSVAGGPNSGIQDPVAQELLQNCLPQFCYIDDINSWSTNEVAINWNSALSWVSAFVADQDNGGATVSGSCAVRYVVQGTVNGVATVKVSLTNTGKKAVAFTSLQWSFIGDQHVLNAPASTFTQDGAGVTITGVRGVRDIGPGKTVKFELHVTTGALANPAPGQFWLNGLPCAR